MAGSWPRPHTGPHRAPVRAWIPTAERGLWEGGPGCGAAPGAEEQGGGSALEKRRSRRLQKTLDAGAPDKERIVRGRGRAARSERRGRWAARRKRGGGSGRGHEPRTSVRGSPAHRSPDTGEN